MLKCKYKSTKYIAVPPNRWYIIFQLLQWIMQHSILPNLQTFGIVCLLLHYIFHSFLFYCELNEGKIKSFFTYIYQVVIIPTSIINFQVLNVESRWISERLFQSHASETSQVQHYMSKNFTSQLKNLVKIFIGH